MCMSETVSKRWTLPGNQPKQQFRWWLSNLELRWPTVPRKKTTNQQRLGTNKFNVNAIQQTLSSTNLVQEHLSQGWTLPSVPANTIQQRCSYREVFRKERIKMQNMRRCRKDPTRENAEHVKMQTGENALVRMQKRNESQCLRTARFPLHAASPTQHVEQSKLILKDENILRNSQFC